MTLSDSDRIAAWQRVAAVLAQGMPREMTEDVRRWRCERALTWRSLAGEWTNIHGRELFNWPDELKEHQDLGVDLCEAAAKVFGEDYLVPPWN